MFRVEYLCNIILLYYYTRREFNNNIKNNNIKCEKKTNCWTDRGSVCMYAARKKRLMKLPYVLMLTFVFKEKNETEPSERKWAMKIDTILFVVMKRKREE